MAPDACLGNVCIHQNHVAHLLNTQGFASELLNQIFQGLGAASFPACNSELQLDLETVADWVPRDKGHINCPLTESVSTNQSLLYTNKTVFDCVDHNKLWEILKEMGIPEHLTCLLRNLYAGQEETELDMEQQTGSKQKKESVKAVYCHPACLIYMQSAS